MGWGGDIGHEGDFFSLMSDRCQGLAGDTVAQSSLSGKCSGCKQLTLTLASVARCVLNNCMFSLFTVTVCFSLLLLLDLSFLEKGADALPGLVFLA